MARSGVVLRRLSVTLAHRGISEPRPRLFLLHREREVEVAVLLDGGKDHALFAEHVAGHLPRASVAAQHRIDVGHRKLVLSQAHEPARDATRVAAHRFVRGLGQRLRQPDDHSLLFDGELLTHACLRSHIPSRDADTHSTCQAYPLRPRGTKKTDAQGQARNAPMAQRARRRDRRPAKQLPRRDRRPARRQPRPSQRPNKQPSPTLVTQRLRRAATSRTQKVTRAMHEKLACVPERSRTPSVQPLNTRTNPSKRPIGNPFSPPRGMKTLSKGLTAPRRGTQADFSCRLSASFCDAKSTRPPLRPARPKTKGGNPQTKQPWVRRVFHGPRELDGPPQDPGADATPYRSRGPAQAGPRTMPERERPHSLRSASTGSRRLAPTLGMSPATSVSSTDIAMSPSAAAGGRFMMSGTL